MTRARPLSRSPSAPGLALFLLALWTVVACGAAKPAPVAPVPADIAIVSQWIMALQYTDKARPSYGAVRAHHTPGYTAPDGKRYFHVMPYDANLGLWGLLRAPVPGNTVVAQRWITWYLRHLNMRGTPPGVVYDHWYLADGSGETTCPPGIRSAECDFDDASDSAAATFLGLVWAYYQADRGGSARFLTAPGTKEKLETVAGVMLALQQDDGLDWAKASYRAKYLMDNSEVYWGLHSMAQLEASLYRDGAAAARYGAAAAKVRDGIMNSLYDPATRLFRIAKFEDGKYAAPTLSKWYPDTVAQVWPQLFGVIAPDSPLARTAMAALNENWGGGAHPDWTNAVVDPGGFLWPSIGYAALQSGDRTRAARHLQFVRDRKFPRGPDDTGFAFPFSVADGGWLLLTLS